MARVYAVEVDLIGYGAPPSVTLPTGAEATRQLTRASERIDELLLTAVYDTDPVTLLPTKANVIAALRDAVCAQVIGWASGEVAEIDTSGQFKDIALGTLKLSRGNASGGSVPRYAEQAVTHLRLAGLLPGSVTYYAGR
ncbi:MAG: hypothetical protein ABIQ18_02340 [Umezawaea sp.]